MNNLFVACNNCGSSLQIDEEIAFVTCRDCEKTLEVVRTFNSVYTKVRETQTWEKPAKIVYQSNKIDANDIYKRIELLDNEWQNTLPTFMVEGTLPDLEESKFDINNFIIYGVPVIFIIIGIFNKIFILFILATAALILLPIFNISRDKNKITYKAAKLNYEQKRAALMERLK
jgi:hypothetical protein